MDAPSGPAIEIDNIYQKWTYYTAAGYLLNGSGLSLGWQSVSYQLTTVPAVGTSLISNVSNQGGGWMDVSNDGSFSIDNMNMMWRSNSPAFTPPADITGSGWSGQPASSLGVATKGPNELDMFWVDGANHLRSSEFNNGWVQQPSAPLDLGPDPAPPGGKPAAVSGGPGHLDVLQLGTSGGVTQLYHRWDVGTSNGWEVLNYLPNTPTLSPSYDVAVASWGPNRLDIFAVAVTGETWHAHYDSTQGGWQGWEDLGGYATSSPAAVSWSNGAIHLFVKSSDNAIYHKWFAWGSGGSWGPSQLGWENLGGIMTGTGLTVSSYQPNRLDVFALQSNAHVMHLIYDNAWSSWWDMGFAAPANPTAVSWGPGRIDLLARDTNSALWQTYTQ
jgi:hypothetical protein